MSRGIMPLLPTELRGRERARSTEYVYGHDQLLQLKSAYQFFFFLFFSFPYQEKKSNDHSVFPLESKEDSSTVISFTDV